MKSIHPIRHVTGLATVLYPLAVVVALTATTFDARAESSQNDYVQAELVADVQSIQPGNPFWVAVRFVIEKNWHINWINPGDAGLAPSIEWTLPDGFKVGDLMWPAPHSYRIGPLVIYGYGNELLLMARLFPPQKLVPGELAEIRAAVDWLACAEACVPGAAELLIKLPVRPSEPIVNDKWRKAMDEVRKDLPIPSGVWNVTAFWVDEERYVIEVNSRGESEMEIDTCEFFPLESDVIEHSAAQEFKARQTGFEIALKRAHMSLAIPERLTGVLVSDSGFAGTEYGDGVKRRAISIDVPLERR